MKRYDGRIDRRRLLGYAAAGAMAGLSGPAWSESKAVPDAKLPDGTDFVLWEQPLSFSKTWYVDNTVAAADDAGPGDQARPFRTINRAAQVLQPGERVVIAAGTYRESVRPQRGGDGPSRMISYEAAPGAKVVIKGSEILSGGWVQQTVYAGFTLPGAPPPAEGGVTTWRHELSGALFPDAYNPFALPSIMASWNWLDPAKTDMGPYLRRRGLVFADGQPLEPVEQLRELAAKTLQPVPDFTTPAVPQNGLPPRRRGGPIMQEVGGSPDARFWVDPSGTAIQIRLTSGTPADHAIEVTTRQHAFLPAHSGLSYIRLKGLTFQHAGNAYPFPQYGMVSLAGGDHWILEDNTLEWANGIGLDIGMDGNSVGAAKPGVGQVVRRNTLRYCGVEGMGGMGTSGALIEDNLIEWCGWADAERGWEAAGAKFHRARDMMFRRNVVRHMRHANAVWWDSNNANCRITANIFADVLTVSAAVHMEMNREANQIDNNIIWDVRNAEPGTPGQRGCAGSGLFINATDRLIVAQNLIGRCDNSGIFAIVRPDRMGAGQARDNTIANNIFAKCGTSAMVFLDAKNTSDGNVYADMPPRYLGFYEGDAKTYLNLADWRSAHGWDRTSVEAPLRVEFDAETLRLTLSNVRPLPKVAAVSRIQSDLLGAPAGEMRVAGPLAKPSAQESWMVDPRRKTGT